MLAHLLVNVIQILDSEDSYLALTQSFNSEIYLHIHKACNVDIHHKYWGCFINGSLSGMGEKVTETN